ncbi:MAG: biopolymer transporter ExbD [Isosphaeraceae bacterium]|nr:biopolymer transporter ExbD [Isosphaeraceae bacterium]
MAGSATGEVKAEPNLTPLLDVVFQLITFFMMVVNFSQDNFDLRIRLPVAGQAKPVEATKAGEDRIVLNIDRDGRLLFSGKTLDTEAAVREIGRQADLVKLNAKVTGLEIDPSNLPTTLVIRADRDTPFSQLFRLISACQANGFRKFALKAMNRGS